MHTQLLTALLALSTTSVAHAQESEDIYLDDIALSGGVTVDIHLRVYDNTSAPCASGTLFAIHGANVTAAGMGPLAEAIVSMPITDRPVCRVVNMDLPGHGLSGRPNGALFGELTIDDYATAAIGSLNALAGMGIQPTTILGHSMGGLVVMTTQQLLLDQGSSLWKAFHIRHAILLSPALPASVAWGFRDGGGGAALTAFTVVDPELGEILALPAALMPALAFSNLQGIVPDNVPSAEDMEAAGYLSAESMGAAGSFFGLEAYEQADVDASIFAGAHKTRLDLITFEQDTLITPTDLAGLFPYLTGGALSDPGFVTVEGDDVVHGYPVSNPEGLLSAFEGVVALP